VISDRNRQGFSSWSSSSRPATALDTRMESQGCRARATETSTPGSRRGPEDNRMDVDAINIVAQILPDWEIDTVTNLPIHMRGCTDCTLFVKHVRQNLQGGSLPIYLECQRKHWLRVLHNKIKEQVDKAHKDGLNDGERDIAKLEEKLGYYHQCVQALEHENDDLGSKVEELSCHNAELRGRRPAPHIFQRGEEAWPSRRPEKRRRDSPLPPSRQANRQPSPPHPTARQPSSPQRHQSSPPQDEKGKRIREAYDTEDDDTSDVPSPLASEDEREMVQFSLQASRRLREEDS
jgi:hypothetical protein